MIPDFLDSRIIHYRSTTAYYQKAQGAYKLVDGMTLPNLLAGPAFDMLFRDISVDKIEKESRALVGRVSSYIQTVVSKLFEGQCAHCPGLLRGIDTNLVGDFVKSKEAKAMEAVSNAVKAGFGWVFTMDPLYLRTITDVQKMVDSFRKGTTSRSQVDAVGKVTEDFLTKMTDCESTSETFAIHTLQVSLFVYTDVVCTHLFDAVSKLIHFFLVDNICEGFMTWMLEKGTPDKLQMWLAEDTQSKRTRLETESAISRFKEGLLILETAGVAQG